MELVIDHAYLMEDAIKPLRRPSTSEGTHTGRGTHPSSKGPEPPGLGILEDLALCISSSGCSSVS